MLSVRDSTELQAVVLSLRAADRTLRTRVNRETVKMLSPVWKQELQARATRRLDARVLLAGARVKGGNPAVAMAATSRRAIGKRFIPAEHWQAVEFGVNQNLYSRYTRRSPKGKVHTVERRVMRGFPPRTPKGRVVYPTFAEVAPRVVSLWVQTVLKTYHDAAEGK